MKKVFCFVAALAALAACGKTEIGLKPSQELTLTPVSSLSVSSAPVTKTSIDGSLQVLWSAGDQIGVYANKLDAEELATPFTLTGTSGASTATFAISDPSLTSLDCADYGLAVYPFDEAAEEKYRKLLTTGVLCTLLPKTQTYVPNNIPNNALVMAARFDPKIGTMTFTPLASVLEIKLYGEVKVSQITFSEYASETSVGGKNLCGMTKISFDASGVPTATTSETSTIVLNCASPVTLGSDAASATSFYVVVSGNASFHHLAVTVKDDAGATQTFNVGGSSTTTLAPGKVYTVPTPIEVKKSGAVALAEWDLGSSYDAGEFLKGAKGSLVSIAETGNANPTNPTSGSGYIKMTNGDESNFRTAFSSPYLCCIPMTEGDAIVVAATGCSLKSGDKVQLLAGLMAYSASTASQYELEYSLDGTNWTWIEQIKFTASGTKTNVAGAYFDVEPTVTLTANATQILFRFRASNNKGTGNAAPNASGQTRIRANVGQNVLAIMKL